MTTYTAQLRRLPALATLRPRKLRTLARVAEQIDVDAGGCIAQAGDRWAGAYLIVEGEAVARADGWEAVLTPGSRFVRCASDAGDVTLVARTPVRALAISRRELADLGAFNS